MHRSHAAMQVLPSSGMGAICSRPLLLLPLLLQCENLSYTACHCICMRQEHAEQQVLRLSE